MKMTQETTGPQPSDIEWMQLPRLDGSTNGDFLRYYEQRYPEASATMQGIGIDAPTRAAFLTLYGNFAEPLDRQAYRRNYSRALKSEYLAGRFGGVIGMLDRPLPRGIFGAVVSYARTWSAERNLKDLQETWKFGYGEMVGVTADNLPQLVQFLDATRTLAPQGDE